jgi:hypothetical protein
MEELLYLSEGNQAVLDMGYAEYLECFFTWFPTGGEAYENSALSDQERVALTEILPLMQQMYSEIPSGFGDDPTIATGWPVRIAPVAKRTLDLFIARGRFEEDAEEAEPKISGW